METLNPLDLVKNLNAQKKQEEAQKTDEFEKEELVEQKKLDDKYSYLSENRKYLLSKVDDFKTNIEKIKGSREEMIDKYREVIDEAKKNPETLEYVKQNFSDIFKDNKLEWQNLRDELDEVKELREETNKELGSLEKEMNDIYPQTTVGKKQIEKEQRKKEVVERVRDHNINEIKKRIDRLEENIKNAIIQKEQYSDILGQQVVYTREQFRSGEAKIISEEATAFTKLWDQFPVNPLVFSSEGDYMVNELKKRKYSNDEIEKFKKMKVELNNLTAKISSISRYSVVGFAKTNDISSSSFPYINIGHGNHYFDQTLLGKQMKLGELFDKEIELKNKQLNLAKEELKDVEIEE